MFTLAISCLTTCNMVLFVDLTFQLPMQYCSYIIGLLLSPVTSTTGCFCFVFLLWLCLFILCGVISPLISSSILGTYQPGELIFQCPFCLFILFRFNLLSFLCPLQCLLFKFPFPVFFWLFGIFFFSTLVISVSTLTVNLHMLFFQWQLWAL